MREKARDALPMFIHIFHSFLLKMALVTCYTHLEKKNFGENFFSPFTPLRAVGLAVELGWKLTRDKGCCCAADLGRVQVAGEVRAFTDRWRKRLNCTLCLQAKDAELAYKVVTLQAAVLDNLSLNAWQVDTRRKGKRRPLDLLCSFSPGKKNYGVEGRVWVELKVWSEHLFDEELENWRTKLETELPQEQALDSTLKGVLLLAAEVGRGTAGSWPKPRLVATLWSTSAGRWQNLAGTFGRVKRGQARHKAPLQETLNKLGRSTTVSEEEVLHLKHLLKLLRLPVRNAGQRAVTLNALLAQRGFRGRIFQKKVVNECGQEPWLLTEETLVAVYPHL